MLRAVCVLVLLSASSAVRPASFGRRGPPRLLATDGDDCTFGGLCTGPSGGVYAVAPGDVYEAVFVVPPLPAIFDLGMTYYVSPGEEVPRERSVPSFRRANSDPPPRPEMKTLFCLISPARPPSVLGHARRHISRATTPFRQWHRTISTSSSTARTRRPAPSAHHLLCRARDGYYQMLLNHTRLLVFAGASHGGGHKGDAHSLRVASSLGSTSSCRSSCSAMRSPTRAALRTTRRSGCRSRAGTLARAVLCGLPGGYYCFRC